MNVNSDYAVCHHNAHSMNVNCEKEEDERNIIYNLFPLYLQLILLIGLLVKRIID